MAVIRPLKGIRYNPEKIHNLQEVITPPYDVIDKSEREHYLKRNPYNFVHIDLPKCGSDDDSNAYARASELFNEWLKSGTFIRDSEPCLYYYELTFKKPSDPQKYVRKGFITLLRLEEFGSGCVYPHEKTFSRVKQDRLNLMKQCKAQLSPIFALYSDPDGIITDTLQSSKEHNPVISFLDDADMEHKIWKVSSKNIHNELKQLFSSKEIYIADGHHRYETAIAYRNEMRKIDGLVQPDKPYEFCLVYLSAMEHPGLTILPTHRMFVKFPANKLENFINRAANFFEIRQFPLNDRGISEFQNKLTNLGNKGISAFGHTISSSNTIYLLIAQRDKVTNYLTSKNIRQEFHDIDVVILDNLIFKELYNLPGEILEDEEIINFSHDTTKAFKNIIAGKYQAGFFINPTRIDQVRRIASACLVMPHKATYFYPKVVSGLVIYKMDEHECYS